MDAQSDQDRLAEPVKAMIEKYRKIAEAVVADAEFWLKNDELSRAIPDAMPDAILVAGADGRIISVNTQFELMFGYHRSEVIGRTPEMLMPQADRASHVAHRASYTDAPRPRDMAQDQRLTALRKNGTEFKVQVKLGPVIVSSGSYTIAVIRKIRA